MFQLLFGMIALIGSTLAVVAIDRKQRRGQVFEGYEVHWGTVVPMAILVNVATLPFYFARTRGSARWALLGVGLFIVCLAGTIGASAAGAAIDQREVQRRHRVAAFEESN